MAGPTAQPTLQLFSVGLHHHFLAFVRAENLEAARTLLPEVPTQAHFDVAEARTLKVILRDWNKRETPPVTKAPSWDQQLQNARQRARGLQTASPCYEVEAEFPMKGEPCRTQTVFCAADDKEATENARAYRKSLADGFERGDDFLVRVQLRSLELGRWDPEGEVFTTSNARHVYDSREDDKKTR